MENVPAKSTRSSTKTKKPKEAAKVSKSKPAKSKTAKAAKKSNADSAGITQQQRQSMIQEMAYLIAERRGFSQGNPTEDWLLAENQVDANLLARATKG